jgi:DNA-binding CsgD family transcriptional regulator
VADLPARHRTLRAAVASSYELLTSEQQAVFRWCGVFAGGFTTEAAADVFADGNQVLDLLPVLAVLADKNLLLVSEDPEGKPRFRWLETIRSFAIDHLTVAGELAIARRRHAEHYLILVEAAEAALTGPATSRTLDLLEREYANLRAVFHWALEGDSEDLSIGLRLAGALHRFWLVRGRLDEALQWLERALPRSHGLPEAIRAKGLNAAGVLAGMQGDNDQAESWFQESLELWRGVGDSTRVAATTGNLGLVSQNRNDLHRALDRFREAQTLYEQAGDQRGIAISLGARALLERQKGNNRQAVPLLERTVTLFRELGDDPSLANSLANLGHSSLALGDPISATGFFTESLQLRQALGNTLAIAECFEGFAALASVAGRPRRAARLYGAAEALREATGAKLLDRADSAARDRQVEEIRKRLGAQTFKSEWAAGRAISADEAARLALRVGPPDITEEVDHPGRARSTEHRLLTRREREVAALVARGLTNRQAGEHLLVATRTIETHLEHIFDKLGVQTRAEVAAWSARQDLVHGPSA